MKVGKNIEVIVGVSQFANVADIIQAAAATRNELGVLPDDIDDAQMAENNQSFFYKTFMASERILTLVDKGATFAVRGDGQVCAAFDGKQTQLDSNRDTTWTQKESDYLYALGLVNGWF